MARAVADSEIGAAQLKERLGRSLKGIVQSVDRSAHRMTVTTAAGQIRTLAWIDAVEVRQGSKPLSPAILKPGQHVTISLTRSEEGEEAISRITLSRPKRARSKASATFPPYQGSKP